MTVIHFDSKMTDEARRSRLFKGEVFVYSPRRSTLALISFAQELLDEAFDPWPPRTAQFNLSIEKFVEIFAAVKPRFIHHPRTKALLRDVVAEMEADLETIYVDVPRLRGATSDKYLTAGVGYAFPPHRDLSAAGRA